MLSVPDTIKYLLSKDNVRKNFRIHFPNGEHEDIINDNIVFESVKFTESLCSRNELKFGLAEASVLRLTTVGIDNIKGCTIECQLEVDVSSIDTTREVLIDDLEFVYLDNGEVAVQDVEFVAFDDNVPTVINDICIAVYLLNIYEAESGYATVYYTERSGWVLSTIRSWTLEEEFPDITDNNTYIYDIASGSLSRATFTGDYWNITGVTNLKDPSSPNYSLYANGIAEDFEIYTSDDLPFPFYVIPYGSFLVDSCERQNDLKKRNIIAMTDVGKFFSLPTYEVSKIHTSAVNDFEYSPNVYGLLSYYGIYSEYITDGEITELTESDTSHHVIDTSYEDKALEVTESWRIGTALDGSRVSIGVGTRIPIDTVNYEYTVANKSGYDDTFDITTVFKIDSISEKELVQNIFDVNDKGYLLTLGAEILTELNTAITDAAQRAGMDANSFLLVDTEENICYLAKSLITLAYAVYKYTRKVNNYKSISTAKAHGANQNNRGEDVYKFAGDLPTLFNNDGFDKYRVYPYFPAQVANNSLVYTAINIPVLALIRLSSDFGFNLESTLGDFDDVEFVTEIDGQEEAFPFVFTAFTDYSGVPFDIVDHVFRSSMTLSNFNIDYTPTMYKSFPSITVQKCTITEEKIQTFKQPNIEKDEYGYYKVSGFEPKTWIQDYMESKGWFCIYDRGAGCYKERSLRKTFHTLYPHDSIYPSPDLFPESTEMKIFKTQYESIWYAENLVGPIEGIKYQYPKPDDEKHRVNLSNNGAVEYDGDDLVFIGEKDKITAFYPEEKTVYNYDITKNNRFDDADEQKALGIVEELYNEIQDVYYMPSSVKAVGVPYIEPGDYVQVRTGDDIIETIVLRRTISGIHCLKDQLESK